MTELTEQDLAAIEAAKALAKEAGFRLVARRRRSNRATVEWKLEPDPWREHRMRFCLKPAQDLVKEVKEKLKLMKKREADRLTKLAEREKERAAFVALREAILSRFAARFPTVEFFRRPTLSSSPGEPLFANIVLGPLEVEVERITDSKVTVHLQKDLTWDEFEQLVAMDGEPLRRAAQ